MESYLSAWKIFRRLSDENVATAEHLVNQPMWPKRADLNITDLGCGDGRLLEEIILRSPAGVHEVRLVDPDSELLLEAASCISQTERVPHVHTIHRGIERAFPDCSNGSDIILIVHVVYLLEAGALREALFSSPVGIPIYIVLDDPNSIFTTLWEKTAPRFHETAMGAHEIVSSLPGDQFKVAKSSISSSVCNPLPLERDDIRDALLSILTYSEVSPLTDPQIREWVERTITARIENGALKCRSTCYEIVHQ